MRGPHAKGFVDPVGDYSDFVRYGSVVPGAGLWDEMDGVPPAVAIGLALSRGTGLVSLVRPLEQHTVERTHNWLVQREPEQHLEDQADKVLSVLDNTCFSFFGASFKDKPFLDRVRQKSKKMVVSEVLRHDGVDIVSIQLNLSLSVEPVWQQKDMPRVLVMRHILEHAYDARSLLRSIKLFMGPDGYVFLEVPDSTSAFENMDYSEIWDEHIHYFTPTSLRIFLNLAGFGVVYLSSLLSDGEEVICVLARLGSNVAQTGWIESATVPEGKGIKFIQNLSKRRRSFKQNLTGLDVRKLFILGANHRTSNFIDAMLPRSVEAIIIDDDTRKQGLLLSSRAISIGSRDLLTGRGSEPLVVSLNEMRAEQAMSSLGAISDRGSEFTLLKDFANTLSSLSKP